MQLTCPKCNQRLPEVETLKYRFCPHCGAEIDAGPRPLDEAFLTIPPASAPPSENAEPRDPDPASENKTPVVRQVEDQTIGPQKRPQIKPPAEPPPPGLFRTPPSEPPLPPPLHQKQPAEKVHAPSPEPQKKQASKNHQKAIVAVLIMLALVILILGGLFTF